MSVEAIFGPITYRGSTAQLKDISKSRRLSFCFRQYGVIATAQLKDISKSRRGGWRKAKYPDHFRPLTREVVLL
jgi:uncharacterized phage-associated protein